MSKAIYLYSQLTLSELQTIVEAHQAEFDAFLEDTFTEDELASFEKKLDALGAIYVQPILTELSFDDFYPDPFQEQKQKTFFESCKSSICIENLPDLEINPFQVSYLIMLLNSFEEILIDGGGVCELAFKEVYLANLISFRSVKDLTSRLPKLEKKAKESAAMEPIDFLVQDVYQELPRFLDNETVHNEMPEKMRNIFLVMKNEKLEADLILNKSGLNPKDFGDNLERLKFYLKKYNC